MLISYPCTYSSSHNDYYQSTFFSGVTWYRTGNISVTANAYGTLILPYGTFTDVIRIKVVENYQDSAYYGGSPDVRYGYSEIYFWYKPGIHLYLMQLVSATYYSSFVSYGVYMDQNSTGVSEYMATEIDYKIYPNPANTFTNICYNIKEPSYLRISLTDILGQEIEVLVDEMKQKGSYHEIVNLEGIDKGLYFIRMETDGRSQTSRISISQ